MIQEKLKQATAGVHKEVEQELYPYLFNESLDAYTYQAILAKFYAIYAGLEHSVSFVSSLRLLMEGRSKLASLISDLKNLNLITGRAVAYPTLKILPEKSIGSALGKMYVMEGATLGGGHITKRLLSLKWISDRNVVNFFNNYGDKRGKMWKDFNIVVEHFALSRENVEEEIIQSAIATFELFKNELKNVALYAK